MEGPDARRSGSEGTAEQAEGKVMDEYALACSTWSPWPLWVDPRLKAALTVDVEQVND